MKVVIFVSTTAQCTWLYNICKIVKLKPSMKPASGRTPHATSLVKIKIALAELSAAKKM